MRSQAHYISCGHSAASDESLCHRRLMSAFLFTHSLFELLTNMSICHCTSCSRQVRESHSRPINGGDVAAFVRLKWGKSVPKRVFVLTDDAGVLDELRSAMPQWDVRDKFRNGGLLVAIYRCCLRVC